MQRVIHQKHHTVDILFVLALFCVFSLSTLAVVYIGSRVYSTTIDTMEMNFNNYTALDYLSQKVHLSNQQIEVIQKDNLDILLIHQTYNQVPYTTYIYAYQNELKELFISDEESFQIEDGQSIMNVDYLKMSIQDSLLHVKLSIHDKENQSYISLLKGDLSR